VGRLLLVPFDGKLDRRKFMDITCIGHSGFLVSLPSYNLIFDYYTDKTGVITPEIFTNKRTVVFVSHNHGDHYNRAIFEWSSYSDVLYILDSGCATPASENIIKLQEGDSRSLYDEEVDIRAYGSTDEGLSFLVNVEDVVLFHAGDLNDWYWADEKTPEELQISEGNYIRIIKQLVGHKIDVAFVPEDPRLGIHAGRAIQHFKDIVAPQRIIPMHFPGNDGRKY
jgi:L-ascorbate metabolism protein UlaG (beta-lactamase superfamily)